MQNHALSPVENHDWSEHQEKVQVTRLQNPTGEGSCHFRDEHSLFISLSPRPIEYMQSQDGKTYRGLYRAGDLLITPANTPLFVRWEGEEDCLCLQVSDRFLRDVARETLSQDSDRLQIIPQFQVRHSPLEAIAKMLLAESQQPELTSPLYLDSLTHVLAINFLRHHATIQPQLPVYEGGLPPRQLQRILDYIDAHLDQPIQLKNLAQLLNMSPFHFSRLFKQSIGLSPHQYVIQQRIERAKQILKSGDRSIIEIALDCGFSSHSHLSKQFRQVTGMTPKAYRDS